MSDDGRSVLIDAQNYTLYVCLFMHINWLINFRSCFWVDFIELFNINSYPKLKWKKVVETMCYLNWVSHQLISSPNSSIREQYSNTMIKKNPENRSCSIHIPPPSTLAILIHRNSNKKCVHYHYPILFPKYIFPIMSLHQPVRSPNLNPLTHEIFSFTHPHTYIPNL